MGLDTLEAGFRGGRKGGGDCCRCKSTSTLHVELVDARFGNDVGLFGGKNSSGLSMFAGGDAAMIDAMPLVGCEDRKTQGAK